MAMAMAMAMAKDLVNVVFEHLSNGDDLRHEVQAKRTRPCWWSRICARARPTPIWRAAPGRDLDGTVLRIDRVSMAPGRDRAFHPGEHRIHGLNVQVIAGRTRAWGGSPTAARGAARHRCRS
jgi:hypothetical protein